ncbi:hypothetical protein, partial [Enterococcus faecalis]
RREQNQHYALLRSQQLLRAKALRVEGPSEISRNSPKIKEQFSEISSYFSELNDSVPTSVEPPYYIKENMWDKSHA